MGREEGIGRGRDMEGEVKSESLFCGKNPKNFVVEAGEKISKLSFRASWWV